VNPLAAKKGAGGGWLATHQPQAAVGGVAAVVLFALYRRSKGSGSAAPTTAGQSVADTTGTDLYNTLEGQLAALQGQLQGLTSNPPGGVLAPPPAGPPPGNTGGTGGAGGGSKSAGGAGNDEYEQRQQAANWKLLGRNQQQSWEQYAKNPPPGTTLSADAAEGLMGSEATVGYGGAPQSIVPANPASMPYGPGFDANGNPLPGGGTWAFQIGGGVASPTGQWVKIQ